MVAESFRVGALVWAKMKGYCIWPGKIVEPPKGIKESKLNRTKKSQHYVYFCGTKDHAWMPDESIVLHKDAFLELYKNKSRAAVYADALVEMTGYSKEYSKQSHHILSRTSEEDISPKSNTIFANSIANMLEKKSSKRTLGHNGEESSEYMTSSKVLKIYNEYCDQSANTPPNIGQLCVPDKAVIPKPSPSKELQEYVECPSIPEFDYFSKNETLEVKNITATNKSIGFLGLGKIGRGIVRNLMQSGHTVNIWDPRELKNIETFTVKGAEKLNTPAEVVIASDITFCCVSDPETAKKIVFGDNGVSKGLEKSKKSEKGYVEMTSIDPKTSEAISLEIGLKGGHYLEAQFIGSVTQAIEGSLLILSAGNESLYTDCSSCFKAMGKKDMFISTDVGIASKFNIVQNMLLGTVYAAVAESLSLVERVGLKQTDFLTILQYGVLDSDTVINKGYCMVKKKYTSNMSLKHMQKNINFALMLGSAVEQPLPIAAATNESYVHCKCLKYSNHDVSAIYEGTRR